MVERGLLGRTLQMIKSPAHRAFVSKQEEFKTQPTPQTAAALEEAAEPVPEVVRSALSEARRDSQHCATLEQLAIVQGQLNDLKDGRHLSEEACKARLQAIRREKAAAAGQDNEGRMLVPGPALREKILGTEDGSKLAVLVLEEVWRRRSGQMLRQVSGVVHYLPEGSATWIPRQPQQLLRDLPVTGNTKFLKDTEALRLSVGSVLAAPGPWRGSDQAHTECCFLVKELREHVARCAVYTRAPGGGAWTAVETPELHEVAVDAATRFLPAEEQDFGGQDGRQLRGKAMERKLVEVAAESLRGARGASYETWLAQAPRPIGRVEKCHEGKGGSLAYDVVFQVRGRALNSDRFEPPRAVKVRLPAQALRVAEGDAQASVLDDVASAGEAAARRLVLQRPREGEKVEFRRRVPVKGGSAAFVVACGKVVSYNWNPRLGDFVTLQVEEGPGGRCASFPRGDPAAFAFQRPLPAGAPLPAQEEALSRLPEVKSRPAEPGARASAGLALGELCLAAIKSKELPAEEDGACVLSVRLVDGRPPKGPFKLEVPFAGREPATLDVQSKHVRRLSGEAPAHNDARLVRWFFSEQVRTVPVGSPLLLNLWFPPAGKGQQVRVVRDVQCEMLQVEERHFRVALKGAEGRWVLRVPISGHHFELLSAGAAAGRANRDVEALEQELGDHVLHTKRFLCAGTTVYVHANPEPAQKKPRRPDGAEPPLHPRELLEAGEVHARIAEDLEAPKGKQEEWPKIRLEFLFPHGKSSVKEVPRTWIQKHLFLAAAPELNRQPAPAANKAVRVLVGEHANRAGRVLDLAVEASSQSPELWRVLVESADGAPTEVNLPADSLWLEMPFPRGDAERQFLATHGLLQPAAAAAGPPPSLRAPIDLDDMEVDAAREDDSSSSSSSSSSGEEEEEDEADGEREEEE